MTAIRTFAAYLRQYFPRLYREKMIAAETPEQTGKRWARGPLKRIRKALRKERVR